MTRARVTPEGDWGDLRRGSGCPQAGDGAENSDSMGHGPSWGLVGLWAQAVGMRAQGTCWGCRAKMVTCGGSVRDTCVAWGTWGQGGLRQHHGAAWTQRGGGACMGLSCKQPLGVTRKGV